MADYYLLHGDWVDPTNIDELNVLVAPVRSWLKNISVYYDEPADQRASIDWTVIRDQLLPDSNQYINDALRWRYEVPLRKTVKIVNGVATEYNRKLVMLAGLYIAYRLETFQFEGAMNPTMSQYGTWLGQQLTRAVNELTSDSLRMRGQRLKGAYRIVNPRFEPMKAAVSTDSSGGQGVAGNPTPDFPAIGGG